MKEVVTIHTGQAGVQISHAVWELACLEHGLTKTGQLMPIHHTGSDMTGGGIDMMFSQCRSDNYTPRAILLDLEPSVIDEVRIGSYRQLWSPLSMISGKEDAASNYARAFYSQARHYIDEVMERLRFVVEQCESLSCFKLIYSANGGTGSGMTSALCEELSNVYGKKFKFATAIYPSPNFSDATVEPYNSILHTAATLEMCDCVVLADNQAIHRALMMNVSENYAGFSLLNRIIARVINAQFLAHRYHFMGQQRTDVSELLINLVPYPRIHFPIMAYAPFMGRDVMHFEKPTARHMLDQAFYARNQLASLVTASQPFISCAILFRGNISPIEAIEAIQQTKANSKTHFVDWCPTGFKMGINFTPPVRMPENDALAVDQTSLSMIAGNLGVKDIWYTTKHHFDLLYSKRAFVHWYVGEGMEEGEFVDGVNIIESLIKEYEDIGCEINTTMDDTEESEGKVVQKNASASAARFKLSENVSSKRTSAGGHNNNVNAATSRHHNKEPKEGISNAEHRVSNAADAACVREYIDVNRSNSVRISRNPTIVRPTARKARNINMQFDDPDLPKIANFSTTRPLISNDNYGGVTHIPNTNWSAAARFSSEISLSESYVKVMYHSDKSNIISNSNNAEDKCNRWIDWNHERMCDNFSSSFSDIVSFDDTNSMYLKNRDDCIDEYCVDENDSEVSSARTTTPAYLIEKSVPVNNQPQIKDRNNYSPLFHNRQSIDCDNKNSFNTTVIDQSKQNPQCTKPPIPKNRSTIIINHIANKNNMINSGIRHSSCASRCTITEASIDDPVENRDTYANVCFVQGDDSQDDDGTQKSLKINERH